jgi:hypothetical protein
MAKTANKSPATRAATGSTRTAPIADDALVKATGRDWAEWCRLLDAEGAVRLSHAEIARMVHDKFNGGDWWSQMVTVGYERLRGLRVAHQRPGGFEISVSKTIAAPIARVYRAWHSAASRRRWLADPEIDFSTANVNKSLRFPWTDGKTRAAADFTDKGAKTAVTVTHIKLADARTAEKMKKYWKGQLEALAEYTARV